MYGREGLYQSTVGAWTVPQGSMVLPSLPTQDQAFLLHSCLPHEILPGRWVSQRVSENELPVAHVLAGVQAACLLELFLHLLDKSGTLLMESSRPPHPACAWQNERLPGPERSVLLVGAYTYITCPSLTWAAEGGKQRPHSQERRPRLGVDLTRSLGFSSQSTFGSQASPGQLPLCL